MSTTSASRGAPLSDEFPVLLRLPDLNTPIWTPPALAGSATPNAANLQIDAVMSEAVNSPEGDIPATTAEAVSAQPITLASSRSERVQGFDVTNFAKWSLVKQLSTGGVLVGGLAIAYLMVMGGGSDQEPPPLNITAGVSPIVSEQPNNATSTPTPVAPDNPAKPISSPRPTGGLGPIDQPPEFAQNWDRPNTTTPTEVAKAAVQEPPFTIATPADVAPAGANGIDREPRNAMRPALPVDPREARLPGERIDAGTFQKTIGPSSGSGISINVNPALPSGVNAGLSARSETGVGHRYPETDPRTYKQDWTTEGQRPDGTARLQGNIAPPPALR